VELPSEVVEQVEIRVKYRGYIERQERDLARFRSSESRLIPPDIDFYDVPGLPRESQERLDRIRPVNFGQAARISGVRPSDVSVLLVYVEKQSRLAAREGA